MDLADLLIIALGTAVGVIQGCSLPVAFVAACVGFAIGSLISAAIRSRRLPK